MYNLQSDGQCGPRCQIFFYGGGSRETEAELLDKLFLHFTLLLWTRFALMAKSSESERGWLCWLLGCDDPGGEREREKLSFISRPIIHPGNKKNRKWGTPISPNLRHASNPVVITEPTSKSALASLKQLQPPKDIAEGNLTHSHFFHNHWNYSCTQMFLPPRPESVSPKKEARYLCTWWWSYPIPFSYVRRC